jgi:hypothetical protein
LKYFSAVRALGPIGSLHIAHINKSEQGDQKPFGSVFWSNGARNIWYVKRSEAGDTTGEFGVGLYHRKANTGRLQGPRCVKFSFPGSQVLIAPTEIGDYPDLCEKLSVRHKVLACLKDGAKTADEIAEATGTAEKTIRVSLGRLKNNVVSFKGASGVLIYGLNKNA